MPLNQAQLQAVEYLNGPLLVLAGPGTGKTQLLSHKVAHILETTDATPESILCLTYMDSGAENMRTRLASIIGRAAHKVNIFTYHAFGSIVLSAYKNYSETFDRSLDAPIDEVTRYKIIQELQAALPATNILRGDSVKDIISTISSAKSARLSASDLLKIAESNLEESACLSSEISPLLKQLRDRMPFDEGVSLVYGPIRDLLATHVNPTPITGKIECLANTLLLELNHIIDTELTKEKPSISPLTSWKKANFDRDADGNYRLHDHVANKKLLSLATIMAEYQQYLAENGLFDFDDMIEQAISYLKSDRGFRLTLSERYQYILLDEFQDTNTSQFELIKLLTDYENPVVMAVGDDDQAICEFQGANASNLLDFQQHYHAKTIVLTENYRSTQEILDYSRQIADQIDDSFAKKQNVVKNLTAKGAITNEASAYASSENSGISRHEFLTAADEYNYLATSVAELVKQGEDPNDIAIITPKHKYVAPLLPYLKNASLSVAYERRSDLLQDPKLGELFILSRFISEVAAEKRPSVGLLEILSFPFWQIDPADAVEVIASAKSAKKSALNYLLDAEDEHLRQIAHFLATLITKSFDTPLELFLDYLIGNAPVQTAIGEFRSNFLAFYTANSEEYSVFELYDNLSVLRDHVKNHTKATAPKLRDLIALVDDYTAAEAALVNSSPYQDSAHAVHVLTANKSKGAEFRHVFLLATDDLAWGKGKGNNNFLVLPKNLALIRHTGVTDDERLRLLFVAITRAKKFLTLTSSAQDFSGKSPKPLAYLPEEPAIISHHDNLPAIRQAADLQTSWVNSYQILTPNLRSVLEHRLERFTMSASNLTEFIDIVYAGPLSFYQNRILRTPQPDNAAAVYGNLIHATMKAITDQKLDTAAALKFFETEAENYDTAPEFISDALDKGRAFLPVILARFGDLLRSPLAKAELGFFNERIFQDEIPITGKIDHLHIDPTTKTIEIYDFKTAAYHPEDWNKQLSLFKYKLQLGFYKLLLNNSREYQNYHVTTGHILFVTPDEDGQVYDKPYDFNPEDEAELKSLIAAIYQHIKKLDFLDPNSPLALAPDKTRKLKAVQDFIKLLLQNN